MHTQDLANILRAKGHLIPQSSEAAALYCADAAPDWADANCCHRCRSNFTLIKRKVSNFTLIKRKVSNFTLIKSKVSNFTVIPRKVSNFLSSR